MVDDVAEHLPADAIVITKSTVPVGTNHDICERLDKRTGRNCDVASNPEFLKEGAAIEDFMKPDRVVVGHRIETADRRWSVLSTESVPRSSAEAHLIPAGASSPRSPASSRFRSSNCVPPGLR